MTYPTPNYNEFPPYMSPLRAQHHEQGNTPTRVVTFQVIKKKIITAFKENKTRSPGKNKDSK